MTAKKKFAVCGDSWFSTDSRYPGCSFSELLASKHDLELINLARSGCSNFAISLQIDRAIELKPDFIIAGFTTWDRIELPNIASSNPDQSFMSWLEWPRYAEVNGKYRRALGYRNIRNSHAKKELSCGYSQPALETVISESINNLIWENRYGLDATIIDALKKYVLHIYDSNIKQQIDCWCMSDASRRLETSGIPFLVYTESLFTHDFVNELNWLDPKHIVNHTDFSYYSYQIVSDPLFHLLPKDAEDFSIHWEQRLIKENFING